jgi:phospholipase/lecithinase/hemolysin
LSHRRGVRHKGSTWASSASASACSTSTNQVTGESDTDLQAFVQWAWDYSGL